MDEAEGSYMSTASSTPGIRQARREAAGEQEHPQQAFVSQVPGKLGRAIAWKQNKKVPRVHKQAMCGLEFGL